jgi:hypothetical protein
MSALPYEKGATPEEAHAIWKRDWKAPRVRPFAMPGKAIVEFGPFVTKGPLWHPIKAAVATSAIMVDDSGDEVPVGTEVAIGEIQATNFAWEGRELSVIDRGDILLMEVSE